MLTIHAADEAIWHFIGLFQLAEEQGRMRIEYDRMAALKADADPGQIEPADISTEAPFVLDGYIPLVRYTPPPVAKDGLATEAAYIRSGPDLGLPAPAAASQPVLPYLAPTSQSWAPAPPPHMPVPEIPIIKWILPPPGSVAVVIVQQNILIDDDSLNAEAFAGPLATPEQIMAKLDGMLAHADLLAAGPTLSIPSGEGAFLAMAQAFHQAAISGTLIDPAVHEIDGAEIFTQQGDQVTGNYLNGVPVMERPDIDALLPEFRKDNDEDEDEDEDNDEDETASAGTDHDGPQTVSGQTAEQDEPESQHELVLGNNTLVNQSNITSAWITAPVVAVGADVYSYTVISQTNIWSDVDAVTGQVAGGSAAGDATIGLNYSSYASFSNPVPERQGDGEAPEYWVTATIEGSLISVNWVEQYNLVSDNEVVSVTIQAEQTFLIMGENGAVNEVSLTELGQQYDLIIIDGHVINLNSVTQTNVMLDDDGIMISGPDGAMVSSDDNLLINDSTIVQVGASGYQPADGGYQATLAATGADGEITLPQSVLDDPAFADLNAIRVLHIKGDLVTVNMVKQTNVLADADQIEVYLDQLKASAEGTIQIITGSNVLINASTITEFGVDSMVHVGGQVYSDALLLQAELVSTDAPLMPDGASALASEAVLFLADGMLSEDGDDALFQPIGMDAAVPADAMETVLA
ncbi:hypothetical protein FNJ84_01080 [Paracoccus sp. M683]|uniref:hypothetical protein n=1 Tax=Paracoccus sp. M683 TaxID=2594268 RepID=UPI00117C4BB4|nr:hypothetical protein [Paracoccus sp. M683]TRW99299.1 hypothetical protein FNJ84_01080 [Paracoccus sp. M683]